MLQHHLVQLSASVPQLPVLAPKDDCLTVEKAQRPVVAVVAAQLVMAAVKQCIFQWCWLRTKLVVRYSKLHCLQLFGQAVSFFSVCNMYVKCDS